MMEDKKVEFIEYRLTSPALCLGERVKKGTYRSTVLTIPYSQITGALWATFGPGEGEHRLEAVGVFTQPDPGDPADVARHLQTLVVGLRDVARDVAKLPIETRVLVDVVGRVFVLRNPFSEQLPTSFTLRMGAGRSKGLGKCVLERTERNHNLQQVWGQLPTRIPEYRRATFGITEVLRPVYGYLFRPDEHHESGAYVRALFEGSRVRGPQFLVRLR